MKRIRFEFPHASSISGVTTDENMLNVLNHPEAREVLEDIEKEILSRPEGRKRKSILYNMLERFPDYKANTYNNVIDYLEYRGYTIKPKFGHPAFKKEVFPPELSLEISWKNTI